MIETAVGGTPATQVIQGERSFDLVVRLPEQFRDNIDAIKNLLIATPDGQHLPLGAVRRHPRREGRVVHLSREQLAVHRRAVQRRGSRPRERRAGSQGARSTPAVPLPSGYTFDWGGEYRDYLAAESQMR